MWAIIDEARANAELKEGDTIFGAGQTQRSTNPRIHFATTGPEIYRDTAGKVDILVASTGTGGTLSGAGRFLKEAVPGVQIVAVEPATYPTVEDPDALNIDGTSAQSDAEPEDRLPTYHEDLFDELLRVEPAEAIEATREIARTDGVLVGTSSGAALVGAARLAARPENKGKNIVFIFPDTGERYLSTVFAE